VRAENKAGGFLEANTGADGIAHIKVDAAKGPFDVTAAKKDFTAVSILDVTGPSATCWSSTSPTPRAQASTSPAR